MPRILRRMLRIALWTAGGLVALVVVLVAGVLVVANTAPGRKLIVQQTAAVTGGMVGLQGVSGRFPDALRVHRITISDAKGIWLAIDDLVLDWHPLALFGLAIDADRVAAGAIEVARLPVASPAPNKPAAAGQGGFPLPLSLRIDALDIPRIAIGAPVAGRALSLAVSGHAAIADLGPVINGPTLDDFPATDLALDLRDTQGLGRYRFDGDVGQGGISLHLVAKEAPGGLIATFAGSNEISPLDLELGLDGPRRAEALHLALSAGKLTASADGLVDLPGQSARLAVTARAPAMQPVAGVAWQSVALDAHLHGRLHAPAADGHLAIAGLAAGGAAIGSIEADLQGSEGLVALHGVLARLRIPGPRPDLLAASPLTLDAKTRLDRPDRPLDLRITHPLLDLAAHLSTAPGIAGHLDLTLPDLAPLAAAGGTDLAGHATLAADVSLAGADASAAVTGRFALTGGMPPAVALIGPDGTVALAARRHGHDLALDRLEVTGRAIGLHAHGTEVAGALDAAFHLDLPALAAASPALAGHLTIDGTAQGPHDDFAATLHAAGAVGTPTIRPEALTLDADAKHLPGAPDARIALHGDFDGAPAVLRADITRDAKGATAIHLAALDWKSLHGGGDLALAPGATLPTGTLDLGIARLSDVARITGQKLAGAVSARLDARADVARVAVTGTGIEAAGSRVGRLALAGTVRDPARNPALDLRLDATGVQSGAIGAEAHATARGHLDALALALAATASNLQGAPATLDLGATLDMPKSTVELARLAADWHGESLRLRSPARITYAPAIAIDRLRLALSAGTGEPALIALDGRLAPTLAFTASLHDVTPALAVPVVPDLRAAGRIDLDAKVAGTIAAPTGTVRVNAAGLRVLTGPAASLPPGTLEARADLAGATTRLDARLAAGRRVDLTVAGAVPTRGAGPLGLAARGRIDLAVANPVLEASGRHLTGTADLDATVRGTTAAPLLGGTLTLARGDLQDFTQGAHLADMTALLTLAGQTLRIDRFTARAGSGTLVASGTAGVLAPGLPVDLRLRMDHASPVSSDLLTAVLDADLRVAGQAAGRLAASGRVTIDRADINIPNGLPSSVATLHVIKPGQKPPPPPAPNAPASVVALDLTLDAPGEIFVRGHGLDAVLGGRLHAGGTATAPEISGGFELRRGSFSLAGTNLTFTKGTVGFNGTTNGKLDPTIDFVAESVVNQYTADLEVSGYASKPKIALHSTPPLPQDQIMALLLFGTDTKSLSPLQIAQIAAALASLSGGGGGFDPLGAVRNTLGLDRLSVGSGGTGATGSGASVEGGKYVTKRVYVGGRQSTSGGGTQALVQIDITKRLKAFTTVGTGGTVTGTTTPENDPGSSIGLKYQFRY